MKQSHVTIEIAKLAKEKGFNENCRYQFSQSADGTFDEEAFSWTLESGGSMDNDDKSLLHAPTQAELQKWLREEKDIYVGVILPLNRNWRVEGYLMNSDKGTAGEYNKVLFDYLKDFDSYEEALEIGLKEALKPMKNTD